MYSALAKAIGSFLNTYQPSATGVTQEGSITYQFERYVFWDKTFRVHVIVESKLEDLEEALQKALDSENYELAGKIRDIIHHRENKSDDPDRETPGAEGALGDGDEPV